MRISDWSSDVCSSDLRWLRCLSLFVHRGGAHFGPTQHRADAGYQEALGEGLGDIVVGAHGEAEGFVQLIVLGGEEDDGDGALLAETPEQLHPVHPGHLDVRSEEHTSELQSLM